MNLPTELVRRFEVARQQAHLVPDTTLWLTRIEEIRAMAEDEDDEGLVLRLETYAEEEAQVSARERLTPEQLERVLRGDRTLTRPVKEREAANLWRELTRLAHYALIVRGASASAVIQRACAESTSLPGKNWLQFTSHSIGDPTNRLPMADGITERPTDL